VIETNIFTAEVLKRQLPGCSARPHCWVYGQAYTNVEAAAVPGIPIGAVMTARRSALKLGALQAWTLLLR
jgi:hypothetical protein